MSNCKPFKFRFLLLSLLLIVCSTAMADKFEIIRKVAEQGDAGAQNNLGLMYDNGEGVPEDDAEAVRWYRLAAGQGHALAQLNLGAMYAKGEGVPEDDIIQAYAWYSIAAAQGEESAEENKEIAAKRMTRAQIAEAQKLSREFWESYGPNREDK